jgi:hypothetical protein
MTQSSLSCVIRASTRPDNSRTMNSLSLCPHKPEISGLVRHPVPTTHLSPPTTSMKTLDSRGADLSLLRPSARFQTDKPLKMSSLSLCPHNLEISGLVRPSVPTTHHPPPTHP